MDRPKVSHQKSSPGHPDHKTIVTQDHYGPLEGGRGDFDQSEIQIPRLSLHASLIPTHPSVHGAYSSGRRGAGPPASSRPRRHGMATDQRA